MHVDGDMFVIYALRAMELADKLKQILDNPSTRQLQCYVRDLRPRRRLQCFCFGSVEVGGRHVEQELPKVAFKELHNSLRGQSSSVTNLFIRRLISLMGRLLNLLCVLPSSALRAHIPARAPADAEALRSVRQSADTLRAKTQAGAPPLATRHAAHLRSTGE